MFYVLVYISFLNVKKKSGFCLIPMYFAYEGPRKSKQIYVKFTIFILIIKSQLGKNSNIKNKTNLNQE